MDARVQRRVQRYGWDRAAGRYDTLWRPQLAMAQDAVVRGAELRPGMHVLDVACGAGATTRAAAALVGPSGSVLGIDLAGAMVEAARAASAGTASVRFARMDAEQLRLPDGRFDAALCAFGLMYLPDPDRALREMRRVLRPGGRVALAAWGERARCGWAPVMEIIDDEVDSEVCPLFFQMGQGEVLAEACAAAGFEDLRTTRVATTLRHADEAEACAAFLIGGPVAMAWSRFDDATRARVRARYLASIEPWRSAEGYSVPSEWVFVHGRAPAGA